MAREKPDGDWITPKREEVSNQKQKMGENQQGKGKMWRVRNLRER